MALVLYFMMVVPSDLVSTQIFSTLSECGESGIFFRDFTKLTPFHLNLQYGIALDVILPCRPGKVFDSG